MDEVTLSVTFPRPYIQATADGRQFLLVVRARHGGHTEYGPIPNLGMANQAKLELLNHERKILTRTLTEALSDSFPPHQQDQGDAGRCGSAGHHVLVRDRGRRHGSQDANGGGLPLG